MQQFKCFTLIFFTLLISSGCSKKESIEDINPALAGAWSTGISSHFRLIINRNPDSRSVYSDCFWDDCQKIAKGKAYIKKGKFHIGSKAYDFSGPRDSAGMYYMAFDNKLFFKSKK